MDKSVPGITVWHHEACRVLPVYDREGRIFLSIPHTHDRFFFLSHRSFLNVDFFNKAVTSIADIRHIVMTLLWRFMTSLSSVT